MAVTNTKFKIADPDLRDFYGPMPYVKDRVSAASSYGEVQPRLLQPVAVTTDVTEANGFLTTNLVQGDILLIVDGIGAEDEQIGIASSTRNSFDIYTPDGTMADA